MKTPEVWLLYADEDLAINRDFAAMMAEKGGALGLNVEAVAMSELLLGADRSGAPTCLRRGKPARPDAVLSRQRDHLVSRHFEHMGAPVMNCARACLICNDKRLTHQFLNGLPMAKTIFVPPWLDSPPEGMEFPQIVKPADGHGGDCVVLTRGGDEWRAAVRRIRPRPVLSQAVVSDAGRDLRVYALFGNIVAGVLREAREGVVSNYKLGGNVSLHSLTRAELELAARVLRRFDEAGAPLAFAGIDLLYERGEPVVGEVEDVVGSRMLYKVSDIDIAAMYLKGVAQRLAAR